MADKKLVYFIILIEGMISISVEILAIRQATPFVGSNIVNTSIIIGVFLLMLSIGYYVGGRAPAKMGEHREFFKRISGNLVKVLVLLGIGLSYAASLAMFLALGSSKMLYLIVFSLFVVGPIVFYLGQTVPILSELFKEERSELSGKILFLSTLGSFAGSIVVSLVFINMLGVSNTIIAISTAIVVTILLMSRKSGSNREAILSMFVLLIIFLVNGNLSFIRQNCYSNISVFSDKAYKGRILSVNRSYSSNYDENISGSHFWYIRKIDDFMAGERGKRVLIAGAGGFTVGVSDKNNTYVFVDVDKDLKEVSEKYFLKRKINGKFYHDGIRSFLKSHPDEKFDVIVSDVYRNMVSIPPLLATREYLLELSRALKGDGTVIFNIIGPPDFSSNFMLHLNNTINSVFSCVTEQKRVKGSRPENIVYFCKKKRDSVVYTDDKINLLEF